MENVPTFLPKSKEIGWVGVQRTFADFFNVSSANFPPPPEERGIFWGDKSKGKYTGQ